MTLLEAIQAAQLKEGELNQKFSEYKAAVAAVFAIVGTEEGEVGGGDEPPIEPQP